MIRREALAGANKTFKKMELTRKNHGKEETFLYAPINEKVKAFRIMSPKGRIATKMISYDKENAAALFVAEIWDEDGRLLANAHAYECKGSSIVNGTSLIENAETSAVGRALSAIGFDVNVNSAPVNSIAEANANIKTIAMKGGKEYAGTDERIGAFRSLYPDGSIQTEIIYQDAETVVFSASAYNSTGELLATATASETKSDKGVNQYHWIENAETSAVGRCLALCGFGIDVSIASASDMESAISFATTDQRNKIDHLLTETGVDAAKLLEHYKVSDLDSLDEFTADKFIATLEGVANKKKSNTNAILDAAARYTQTA